MRVLKPLDRDGYSKEPFVAYASQSYTIVLISHINHRKTG